MQLLPFYFLSSPATTVLCVLERELYKYRSFYIKTSSSYIKEEKSKHPFNKYRLLMYMVYSLKEEQKRMNITRGQLLRTIRQWMQTSFMKTNVYCGILTSEVKLFLPELSL